MDMETLTNCKEEVQKLLSDPSFLDQDESEGADQIHEVYKDFFTRSTSEPDEDEIDEAREAYKKEFVSIGYEWEDAIKWYKERIGRL